MIQREEIDGVTVVRLAHGKVNALDLELLTAITETFAELKAQGLRRPIVLTGAGGAFSAGVDLWRMIDGGEEYVRAFLPALSDAFSAIFDYDAPVVAAVNGHAIAGGAILAACCDHRVMGERGRIGVTELLVGVPFPVAALEILIWACGDRNARQAVVNGATYAPAEALERGFVDELSEDPLATALETARRLAEIPSDSFALTKQQLRQEANNRIAARAKTEDPQVGDLWTARVTDGYIRAYMEKVTARR